MTTDGYNIRKGPSQKPPLYYIEEKDFPEMRCIVECFNLKQSDDADSAKKLKERIERGEEIGTIIEGYTICVHPSNHTKRSDTIITSDNLRPIIQKMSEAFKNEVIDKEPYLFYDFLGSFDVIACESKPKKAAHEHYLSLSSPERQKIEGLQYKFTFEKKSHLSFVIDAVNDGGVFMHAKGTLYTNDSLSNRKRIKRLIKQSVEKNRLVAKVEGYQIFIEAKMWDNKILSDEDALVMLNQMARYYAKHHFNDIAPYSPKDFKDTSEEEYQRLFGERDKKNAKKLKTEILISLGVLSVFLSLLFSGFIFRRIRAHYAFCLRR